MGLTSVTGGAAPAVADVRRRRLVLVPRWGASAVSDWYPGVLQRWPDTVVVPLLPTPEAPEPGACVAAVQEALAGADPADLVLLGHSVGCQALLRTVAADPPDTPYGAVVLVAGWVTVDEPWESLVPWLHPTVAIDRPDRVAWHRDLLVSDNDPYTADHRATVAAWRALLEVSAVVQAGAAHFNAAEQDGLVGLLEDRLTGRAS